MARGGLLSDFPLENPPKRLVPTQPFQGSIYWPDTGGWVGVDELFTQSGDNPRFAGHYRVNRDLLSLIDSGDLDSKYHADQHGRYTPLLTLRNNLEDLLTGRRWGNPPNEAAYLAELEKLKKRSQIYEKVGIPGPLYAPNIGLTLQDHSGRGYQINPSRLVLGSAIAQPAGTISIDDEVPSDLNQAKPGEEGDDEDAKREQMAGMPGLGKALGGAPLPGTIGQVWQQKQGQKRRHPMLDALEGRQS
jgi:hypothetical protein